jgi:hypothetical protein
VVFNINQPGAIKRVLEGDREIGNDVRSAPTPNRQVMTEN